jgi:acetyl esterase/lipase
MKLTGMWQTRAIAISFAVAAALRGGSDVRAVAAVVDRYRIPIFAEVVVEKDIVFGKAVNASGKEEVLHLDVYTPEGDTDRRRSAILFIHGGGFRPGQDKRQKYIVMMATEFARRGYVAVSPDYRVRANRDDDRIGTLRDAVEDCRGALAWMREHAAEQGIDRDRIAVGGGSAGGMIATSLVGLENAATADRKTPGLFALVNLWGSPAADMRLCTLDAHYPPSIIIHGTADTTVPFERSEQFAADLEAAGVERVLVPIPNAPHTPSKEMPEIVERAAVFVHDHLPAAASD